MKRAAASTLLSAAADSRLAEAMSVVTSASASVGTLQRNKVDTEDPVIHLLLPGRMRPDEALRWVAAAEVARGPAPSQVDVAVGGAAALLIMQTATTALTAAIAAARVRVDLARKFCDADTSGGTMQRLREAKRGLFTAECRLATPNP